MRVPPVAQSELASRAIGYMRAKTRRLAREPRQRRAIVLLACVLGLNAADQGTIGAVARQLELSFHISNTQLGLLATIASVAGMAAAIPLGILADRTHRVRLLAGSVALWSLAMAASGASTSYVMLLLSRLTLGAVAAASGPVAASLIGDLFPAAARARVYSLILTGELVGAGFGLVVSSDVSAIVSWRGAFGLLAAIGIAFAWLLWRKLPEPPRGGQGEAAGAGGQPASADETVRQAVAEEGIPPDPRRVLRRNPATMPYPAVVRYVLRVPTNVVLIVSSALGYFFFSGLRTFALVFVESNYGISQATVSGLLPLIGVFGVAGVLAGGRIADRLVARGHLAGRIIVPAVGFSATALCVLPAVAASSLAIAIPLLMLGAAALGSSNPPLDAARLDVMPSALWGRAESVRTFLRTGAEAAAPVLFGVTADFFGGHVAVGQSGASQHAAAGSGGLKMTFLIMLAPLLASGLLLARARHTYPRDVASARVSEQASRPRPVQPEPAEPERTPPARPEPEERGA